MAGRRVRASTNNARASVDDSERLGGRLEGSEDQGHGWSINTAMAWQQNANAMLHM